jgi:hypothetical protein
MQILVIGKEDSPLKCTILGALILIKLKVDSISLTELFSRDIDDVDCVIYIDCRPSSIVIDRLRKNSRSLILVADENINCNNNDLFIPTDSFSSLKTVQTALERIIMRVEFLGVSERQRNIFHLILDPQLLKSIESLRRSMAVREGDKDTRCSRPIDKKRLLKKQESKNRQDQILQYWIKGMKRDEILSQVNVSPRTLDRIIAKAKIQHGASDCRQLINKLQV